jgi:hypothetical protein
MHLVQFGILNRNFGPCLPAISRVLPVGGSWELEAGGRVKCVVDTLIKLDRQENVYLCLSMHVTDRKGTTLSRRQMRAVCLYARRTRNKRLQQERRGLEVCREMGAGTGFWGGVCSRRSVSLYYMNDMNWLRVLHANKAWYCLDHSL